jgi:catechol 2,3-dioxygenase-like lactoylglutathione lyase family enzyme
MRTHLNFATLHLDESVAFYSVLLNAKPLKLRDDYALFITNEPAMELALDVAHTVDSRDGAHYGIYVESADLVERAIERLQSANLPVSVEREETCCYANQTKVWTGDPDGRPWEVYAVHEETETRDAARTCCSAE